MTLEVIDTVGGSLNTDGLMRSTFGMKEGIDVQRAMSLIVMFMFFLVGIPLRGQPSPSGDIDAVKRLEQFMGSAMVDGNVEELKQIYADDFATIGSDGAIVTKTALLADIASSHDRLEWFENGPIDVQVFGNIAVAQGFVKEKRRRGNGEEASSQSFWQDLLEKRAGKWVVWRSAGAKVISGSQFNAQSQNPAVAAVIKDFENRLGQAMVASNVEQIGRAYADDWATITSTGEVFSKDELMQDFRSGNHKLTWFQNGRPMNVQVLGDVALVQTSVIEKRIQDGKDISGVFVFMDLLKKREGQWEIVRTLATKAA
jgi:hypothetical protein